MESQASKYQIFHVPIIYAFHIEFFLEYKELSFITFILSHFKLHFQGWEIFLRSDLRIH